MITVVLPFWIDKHHGWRQTYHYTKDYVYRSVAMIRKHLTLDHEFVILTDHEFPEFRTVNIDPKLSVPGKRFQKLMIFHPQARELFGERILLTDLDNVFTGNIDRIVNRPEDIVLWQSPSPSRTQYNTSLVLYKAGTRNQVYTDFEPAKAIKVIADNYLSGTDQAYVSHVLKHEATWTKQDGIYSYKYDFLKQDRLNIPEARIVSFHGRYSPAMLDIQQRYDWVRENYG